MSTDQPTLEEFDETTQQSGETRSLSARTLDRYDGAVYGGHGTAPQHRPADAGCCLRCGEPVAEQATDDASVRRVYGDQHDRVPACPSCPDIDAETVAKAVTIGPSTSHQAREITVVEAHEREVRR